MKRVPDKVSGPILLALAAVIWGLTFIAQSEGDSVGGFTFQAIRSILGFFTIAVYLLFRDRKIPKRHRKLPVWLRENKALLIAGCVCGVALGAAMNLQQFGILMQGQETSTGRAGFITAIYIVLVPIIGIFRRKLPPVNAWLGVCIAAVGLYLISVPPGTAFGMSRADFLLLLGALGFALQITFIDVYVQKHDAVKLSAIQFLVAAIVSAVLMAIFEKPTLTGIREAALPIVFAGVFSGGIAFTLQSVGQQKCNPTLAALIMSMESVFTTIFDFLIRHNRLELRELIGCAVVFTAVILAQLPFPAKRKKDEKNA